MGFGKRGERMKGSWFRGCGLDFIAVLIVAGMTLNGIMVAEAKKFDPDRWTVNLINPAVDSLVDFEDNSYVIPAIWFSEKGRWKWKSGFLKKYSLSVLCEATVPKFNETDPKSAVSRNRSLAIVLVEKVPHPNNASTFDNIVFKDFNNNQTATPLCSAELGNLNISYRPNVTVDNSTNSTGVPQFESYVTYIKCVVDESQVELNGLTFYIEYTQNVTGADDKDDPDIDIGPGTDPVPNDPVEASGSNGIEDGPGLFKDETGAGSSNSTSNNSTGNTRRLTFRFPSECRAAAFRSAVPCAEDPCYPDGTLCGVTFECIRNDSPCGCGLKKCLPYFGKNVCTPIDVPCSCANEGNSTAASPCLCKARNATYCENTDTCNSSPCDCDSELCSGRCYAKGNSDCSKAISLSGSDKSAECTDVDFPVPCREKCYKTNETNPCYCDTQSSNFCENNGRCYLPDSQCQCPLEYCNGTCYPSGEGPCYQTQMVGDKSNPNCGEFGVACQNLCYSNTEDNPCSCEARGFSGYNASEKACVMGIQPGDDCPPGEMMCEGKCEAVTESSGLCGCKGEKCGDYCFLRGESECSNAISLSIGDVSAECGSVNGLLSLPCEGLCYPADGLNPCYCETVGLSFCNLTSMCYDPNGNCPCGEELCKDECYLPRESPCYRAQIVGDNSTSDCSKGDVPCEGKCYLNLGPSPCTCEANGLGTYDNVTNSCVTEKDSLCPSGTILCGVDQCVPENESNTFCGCSLVKCGSECYDINSGPCYEAAQLAENDKSVECDEGFLPCRGECYPSTQLNPCFCDERSSNYCELDGLCKDPQNQCQCGQEFCNGECFDLYTSECHLSRTQGDKSTECTLATAIACDGECYPKGLKNPCFCTSAGYAKYCKEGNLCKSKSDECDCGTEFCADLATGESMCVPRGACLN
eukprot:Nk52_evm31s2496 gene=Nk52_evmTU31s2496